VLLKSAFGVALRPEHFPDRRALSGDRGDKLLDVALHLLDLERERHDIPAVLPLGVSIGKYLIRFEVLSALMTICALRRRRGMFQVSIRASSASPIADCISVIR